MLFSFILISFDSYSQDEISFLNGSINNCNSQLNFIQINDSTATYTNVYSDAKITTSKIYYSNKIKNRWCQGLEYLNTASNLSIANLSLSDNKGFNFYTKCNDGITNCDIYFTLKDKEFSLSQINSEAFSADYNTQPFFFTFNKKSFLYFVSDRKGGFGGLDIWFTIIDSLGNFSFPINAGPNINSSADEITPFYTLHSKTLYFSSSRDDIGLGGFDIYSSSGSTNRWTSAINLFYLNSEHNEMYFSLFNERHAFFSSDRITDSSFCCNNIYSFEFENDIVDVQIINKKISSSEFTPLQIYFDNNSPNARLFDVMKDTVPSYKKFYIDYFKNRESYYTDNNDSILDFFFDSSLKDGYTGLISILENALLDLSKGLFVELTIQGYASPLASDNYNKKLSFLRIKSIINFINEYSDLALAQYILDSSLIINELPLGESESFLNVSDDPEDVKKSILSMDAILSRKVTILKVESYR